MRSDIGLRALTALALCAALLQVAAGCSTSGCTDNQNAIPYAVLYDDSAHTQISLTGIAIGGVGAPNDSLLVDSAQTVSSLYMPLRASKQSASFFIRYLNPPVAPELYDTLTIDYGSTPWFAGEDCGASYRYNITRVTHTRHYLDSVAVLDSLVTNIDRQYLSLYFSPRPIPEPEEPEEGDDTDEEGGDTGADDTTPAGEGGAEGA